MLSKFDKFSLAQKIPGVFKQMNITKRRALLGAVFVSVLIYGGLFALPKTVHFSYASKTCTGQFSILPKFFRSNDSSRFVISYQGGFKIAGNQVTATRVCFAPTRVPSRDMVSLANAPFGSFVFRNSYNIVVGEAPHILPFSPTAQAASKPLSLKLSQSDLVLNYALTTESKAQACKVQAEQLLCGVDKLGLSQGSTYSLGLKRSFNGKEVGSGAKIQVMILPATHVINSTIKANEIIYSKPKSEEITFDKDLSLATAKLEQVNGGTSSTISTSVRVIGTKVIVDWPNDLPREKSFRLSVLAAEASDGSAMDGAYVVNFATSGGPKVVGVSIANSGIDPNVRAIITFDQELSKDSNINLASISGGSATVSRQGSNQIVFSLHNVPRCSTFNLNVAKGIKGENGISSDQAWTFDSRIICGTMRTIGYSVKGRPINAYFFGTGAATALFTGGIHGNEPSGTYIMQDWVTYLGANAYKIPADKQVVVVPNLNPDGIATNQRYNAHNVNLDRNFPSSDWVSDISLTNGHVLTRGGGVTALSEPETRAIADLTSSLHVRAEVSFHSSGSLVGANKIADSVSIGSIYARGVGYTPMFYNPETVMGYTLTGEYETWMGEKFGTPAILIELPTSSGRFFSRHLNTLWAMVNL